MHFGQRNVATHPVVVDLILRKSNALIHFQAVCNRGDKRMHKHLYVSNGRLKCWHGPALRENSENLWRGDLDWY